MVLIKRVTRIKRVYIKRSRIHKKMNWIEEFKKGSGIHIKKKNRGKFTKSAKAAGEGVQEHAHKVMNDPNATPLQKKRANFAIQAKKWHKHKEGGVVSAKHGMDTNRVYYSSEEIPVTLNEQTLNRVHLWEQDKPERAQKVAEQEDTGWDDLFSEETTSGEAHSSSPARSTSTSAEVRERQKTAMNYLITKHGFSKEAAAGVVGVLTAESNLIPGVTNKEEASAYGSKAGKGIAQWSNERRTQYDKAMQGKQGLEAELDFFVEDLKSRPLVVNALKTATTVEDAVKAMHLGYENGSATAMLTPEQMTAVYTPAWKKLYGDSKKYDYTASHNIRLSYANTAYSLV